jgi:hypothetical protein
MKRSSANGMSYPTEEGGIGLMYAAVWVGLLVTARRWTPTKRTIRFWQEIYDDQGTLVEIHEKFPVDKGRQRM